MKKKLIPLLFIISLLFTGCDFLFNLLSDISIDLSVYGFGKDSVVLSWTTDIENARYNIYVKDKNNAITCVEENWGKTDYFVVSDDKSSYAIGVLVDDSEILQTSFVYPKLEPGSGFPVKAEISEDSYLGVEFLYPSNVDYFSLEIIKEGASTIIPTTKNSAAEMTSYLFPLRYEKNSHNNQFSIVFTKGKKDSGVQYKSAPYYFDYDAHIQATEKKPVTFYPDLWNN